MNKCMFRGNLTRDPEVKKFENGALAIFTLAVRDDFKNKSTGKYDVTFVDCKAWGNMAINMGKYLKKGSQILFTGHYKEEKYIIDGENKKHKVFIADEIEYIGGKKESESEETRAQKKPDDPSGKAAAQNDLEQAMTELDKELADMGLDLDFELDNPFQE